VKRGVIMNTWGNKLVKYLHLVRLVFKRLLVVVGILFFGTALLSIYSVINFVNNIARVYNGNPSTITAIALILVAIPLLSYLLEKGINSYQSK
jgi:uncharacterized membrane protein YidH (DUF202 family)